MAENLKLFNKMHCIEGSNNDDFTNKILVLKANELKEQYRTPENQLFYAYDGFGCNPNALGTRVYGCFVSDMEETSFRRCAFEGVLKDECMPEFAKEFLDSLKRNINVESDMGGIACT
jgi:hypothetical protein